MSRAGDFRIAHDNQGQHNNSFNRTRYKRISHREPRWFQRSLPRRLIRALGGLLQRQLNVSFGEDEGEAGASDVGASLEA